MNSVTATDKARHWQDINGGDLDREKEDQENLDFCDQRELLFRRKNKRAREDVCDLERQRDQLQLVVDRTKRLQRTEIEYWEEGDLEFWTEYMGNILPLVFSFFLVVK